MKQVTLNNGITMPLVGLGTWNLNGKECKETVCTALQMGYRLIDTAQMYGNEKEVAAGIKESGISRNDIFITTKIYGNSNSYEKTKAAIQQSLSNLDTDYIDLMLLHEPYSQEYAMYQALEEAYLQGIVKAIGISNYDQNRLQQFLKHCRIVPAVNQVECHIYYQKKELQKVLETYGIQMQAWAPLAQAKANFANEPEILSIANQYHKTAPQIALKYLLQRGIAIIPKSKRKDRLMENMNLFDFELTDQDMEKISHLDRNDTLFSWTRYL